MLQWRKSVAWQRVVVRGALVVVVASGVAETATAQRPTPADSTRRDSTGRVVLAPVEVSVTRRQANVADIPFSISLVDGRELREGRATAGLDEALGVVPGLLVSNRYNPSLDQRISIRGFGARSAFGARGVKILLDGIPQTLPDGQGQLTNVELSSVGAVEVLRGSASSLYGNASGGVIALQTEVPSPTVPFASARVVGGAYGFVKTQGRASGPVGRGTLAVNAARTTGDGYRDHSEFELRNIGLRLEQELSPGTTILVSAHVADDPRLDNPGSLTASQADSAPAQANSRNVSANAGKDVSQMQLGATVSRAFASGARVNVTAFGLTRDLNNPLSFAFIQIDRSALGARATAELPATVGRRNHRFTVGVDIQRQRDDRVNRSPDLSAITRDQLERVTEIGPFTQLAVDLHDRLTVTLGSRYDRITFDAQDRLLSDGDDSGDRVMSSWSGSAGVVVHASPDVQPYGNVSTSFETPTTTELANRPTGPGGFNPDLDPQKATSYEVGIRARAGGRAQFSAAVFRAEVRDELIPFEVPTEPSRQFFRNAGTGRHQGIEVGATVRPVAALTVLAAYTFADHTFRNFRTDTEVFDGNAIPGIPEHRLYASTRVRAPWGGWVAGDYNVSSGYFVDDGNSIETDGWVTVDIRGGVDRTVGPWRFAPFFGVLNAFDERYVSSVVVNASFGRFFEPAPPRNLFIGLEISPASASRPAR